MTQEMKLSPKQQYALRESTRRLNFYAGPVRSGKTHIQKIAFIDHMYSIDGDKFLATGSTKATLKRNVLEDIISFLGEKNCGYNNTDGILTIKGGKKIYCVGCDDEAAEKKIRGSTYWGWLGDELTLHKKSAVDAARTRLSPAGSKMFWTTNPDSPFHYLMKDYIEKDPDVLREEKGLDMFFCKFELDDNPSLTEEFKKELRNSYTGVFYQRMILGNWVLADGVIYDNLVEENYFYTTPPIIEYWIGVDYGTSTTTVFILLGKDKDGNVYVLDEWTYDAVLERKQKTDVQLREDLEKFVEESKEDHYKKWNDIKFNFHNIYVDPSAASFKLELENAGLPVRNAENDVDLGLKRCLVDIKKITLRIHYRCKKLRSEMSSSYIWDPRARAKGIDKPLKENDHHCDGLRYGHYSHAFRGGEVLSEIKPTKIITDVPRMVMNPCNERLHTIFGNKRGHLWEGSGHSRKQLRRQRMTRY